MNLLMIIAGVLLALLIIVPLLERFGKRHSDQEIHKVARWIFPVILLLMVLQAFRYFL